MRVMKFSVVSLRWLALGSALLFVQCAEDPADQADTAAALVEGEGDADAAAMELANGLDFGFGDEAEGETEEVVEEPEPRVFVFESDSKVGFIGSKPTAIHEGSFGNFTGFFSVLGDRIDVDGVHRVSIDMASVTTEDDKLTEHLKGEDFFDVAKFPVTTFTLLKMNASDVESAEGASGYDVVGLLDLHGVKKKITFPATVVVGEDGNSLAMKAKFSIERKLFGIEYAGVADDLIRDRVVIDLDLKSVPGDPSALQLTSTETRSQPMVFSAPTNAGDPRGGASGGPGGGGKGKGGGGRRGGTPGEMIARMDANGDGKINKDEAPEFVWERISSADTDGDGSISEAEYTVLRAQREAEGGGFGRGGGGGKGGGGDGKGGGDRGGDR
jgi:polyisoprenoid-binding protein YceI